ncbi:MAG: Gfo/Idh/MocA family oxidoreductase [Bacteroidota bacterium]|nr:Gfo/Idh/MocA family oxidoreductase [Bacteroidota bacterium]MDP4192003.1 Gfo/Idh/MocA family oxidoreductase [Bacteroidota bacterium]
MISRREFLKKISVIAGSTVALASMPWMKVFNEKVYAKSVNDKVRLGFIGIGDRGSALLKNVQVFEKILNVEIAAICDNYEPNYQRAIKFTNGKAKPFYDYRELLALKDLDGVIIATPLTEHCHITLDALDAGLSVFCEKSMARTLDDSKRMYDEHLRTKRILQIGHQRVFSPIYLEAIEKINKGEIGQITHMRGYWHRNGDWRRPVPKGHPELDRVINWRLYNDLSAGLFTELLSHQLQVANWIKQSFPTSVIANGSLIYWKKNREVYDHIACLFSYPDQSQFMYDSINSNKHYGCEEQIIGSKGTMELELNKVYSENPPAPPAILKLINDMEKDVFDTIPIGGASWVPETAVVDKGNYITNNYKMDETKLQLEAFVRYIRNGQAPEELPIQGYYSTVWSLLAEESAKTKERVTLMDKYRI